MDFVPGYAMRALFCAVIAVGIIGCNEESVKRSSPIPVAEEQTGSSKPSSADAAKPVGPFEKRFDGIRFQVPEGWREVALSDQQKGFIDARFLIPLGDAELQLTCSSIGGGVKANVDRWIGQFQLPPGEQPEIETIPIDGAEATWVDLRGKFQSRVSGTGSGSENWRMLGVAFPMQPRDFYLKLTGPSDQIAEVRETFREFVKSAQID
jgi:hypothetical protein